MEKQFRYDFQTAVVETDKGLVHGYEYDGMSIFKGIPYARSKRFHDPEPVEPWDGLREATGYGYVCPLLDEERLDSSLGAPTGSAYRMKTAKISTCGRLPATTKNAL